MDRRTLFLLSVQLLLLQSHTPSASSSFQRGQIKVEDLPTSLSVSLKINCTSNLLSITGDDEINVLGRPQHKIFHPPSNSCIFRHGYGNPLTLAPCTQSDSWNYTPQKFLTIVGTYYCLKAVGPSLPAELSISCDISDSQWNIISDSGETRFSTNLDDGTTVCLDVYDSGTIVTNPCQSFSKGESASDGDSQWFQINTFRTGKD